MKNRIIALILVCVMSVAALASCGAAKFNFAENSGEFVTIDLEGFKKAIEAIEIEDEDFTTNEETRAEKVIYNILTSLTSAAVKNNDKLTTGSLTENDVLYFVYYCTYVDENDVEYVFYGDQMKASTITTSTTKANHVVELATVLNNEDAKLGNAIYKALTDKFDEDGDGKFEILLKNEPAEGEESVDLLYDSVSTSGTAVKELDTIVISYTRKPVLPEGATEEEIAAAKSEKVLYMELVLDKTKYEEGSEEAVLVDLFLGENMTTQIGKDIFRTDKEEGEEKGTDVKTFDLTVDGKTYTYSEIGVEWKVEKNGGEILTFKHTPYPTTSQKLENNKLHTTDAEKIDIKGKELTYHLYPVSYIDVSEISAESIIKEIFGSSVSTTSIELFESEEYKNGEDTVKSLVETLVKIWKEDAELVKTLKNADGKTLEELGKAITDAQAELKKVEATNVKYEELKKAVEDAEKAYEDAHDYCVDEQIKKILDATKDGKALREVFVDEYKSDVYDTLKKAYDSAIVDAVGDALWLLVEKYVVVNSYPEKLVEEFYNHIYEQHEYDFYNNKYNSSSSSSSTSTESNYAHYKGDLEAYLVDATGAKNGDYKAAITEDAKEYLEPMLQIFALAAAIEGDSTVDITAVMKSYTEADEKAGAYKIYSHEGHEHGEAEAAEEEKKMREAYENALADAEHFLLDDEALKAYKKYIGKASYKAYIDNYGEHNLRAALQLNRLMYYLLSTNVSYDDEGTKTVNYKTLDDGSIVLDFRTVNYVLKADEAEDNKDAE